MMIAMSAPGFPLWGLFIGLALVVVVLVWVGLVIADVVAAARGRPLGTWSWHAVCLAAVLAVAISVPTFAPLRARFALSKGSMQEIADRCLDASSRDESCDVDGRVGLYLMFTATTRDDDVVLYVSGMSFLDSGFVYAPDGDPPGSAVDFEAPDYLNLGDGWFAFTASF